MCKLPFHIRMLSMLLLLCVAQSQLYAAEDASYCLERFRVVDVAFSYKIDAQTKEIKINLPSQNSIQGIFQTEAAYYLHYDSLKSSANISFDFESTQKSLEYNLYKVELIIDQGDGAPFLYSHDFTQNCTKANPSLLPGDKLSLPNIKIPPPVNGVASEKEKLRIRIWGHL